MTKLEKFKSQLKLIDKEMSELTDSRREVRTQIAVMNCPFKVGDVLINRRDARAVLVRITWWGSATNYQMHGFKLKNNGDRYKLGMILYQSDNWRPANA